VVSDRGKMREGRAGRTAHASVPADDRVVTGGSLARVLVAATARALRGVDCRDLGSTWTLSRLPGAPEAVRRAALARAAGRLALPEHQFGAVDADRVARWIVEQYPQRTYPGVVLGSPHGAAAHLAVALGMPWLPAGFETAVHWGQGGVDRPGAAYAHGVPLVARLRARNPDLHVRQVHCPATRGSLAGSTLAFAVRWQRLPRAYRDFLAAWLEPGAPVLLLRDSRTWPVFGETRGHSLQVGSAASGLAPADFSASSRTLRQVLRSAGADGSRWDAPRPGPPVEAEHAVDDGFADELQGWAARRSHPLHRVLFPCAEALSAVTADLYRHWLRAAGKTGDRLVVECGRLLDPWQVLRAGLVPYWCENATRRAVTGAEWWLAGSAPFSSVDVLPEPPGMQSPALAGLAQWLAVASFGRRRRSLDRGAARGYPVTAVSTRRVSEVLRGQPYDTPPPPRLRAAQALDVLRDGGAHQGLLVC